MHSFMNNKDKTTIEIVHVPSVMVKGKWGNHRLEYKVEKVRVWCKKWKEKVKFPWPQLISKRAKRSRQTRRLILPKKKKKKHSDVTKEEPHKRKLVSSSSAASKKGKVRSQSIIQPFKLLFFF